MKESYTSPRQTAISMHGSRKDPENSVINLFWTSFEKQLDPVQLLLDGVYPRISKETYTLLWFSRKGARTPCSLHESAHEIDRIQTYLHF